MPASANLPVELWLIILSIATHIPGAYDCNNEHAVACFVEDEDGICLRRLHREATNTILSACLVCKAWAEISNEFLFRYLLVLDGAHAIRIASALGNSGPKSASSDSPGRWTRRLELAMEGVHIWTQEHKRALIRIFRSCPKLTVFSTAFCTSDVYLWQYLGLAHVVCNGLQGSRLRRLELKYDSALLRTLLPHLAPTLEVVWVLPPIDRRTAGHPEQCTFALPKVHTLAISYQNLWTTEWTVPTLRTVIAGHDRDVCSSSPLTSFLRIHGAKVRHLVARPEERASRSHESILTLCPNVVDWTTPEEGTYLQILEDRPTCPSLRLLTVDVSSVMRLPLVCRILYASLATAGTFASLKCIRLRLPLPRAECSPPFQPGGFGFRCCEDLLEVCCRRGILVEVSLGMEEHFADCWRPFSVETLFPQNAALHRSVF
ncbi:hypothetical protein WOLCODRAFT_135874 [Wolfiporia cocos MD-104 SS10]|uniref:F-box domain-containing protein n=1 Tax=Wolfiporia cocos (strain MD-104) TaxID=742152 RepID=A0A2H3JDF7_WOLCO|nr:hypothetical protein WOLCODRAFT_135874 [Wolfiporia cocos MD-104 SS10]